MKKIIKIIRNPKDERYGTAMLILSLLLVILFCGIWLAFECKNHPL